MPDERLAAVAEHYYHFGGVSPINRQCRALLAAHRPELDAAGVELPLYWGNRNWHPFLSDTVAQMRDAGVHRALAFVTSPFGSYSSCRQYWEDFAAARAAVGAGAPEIDKIRHYHDHPGFVRPHAEAVRRALHALSDVDDVRIVFTAHSIPSTMEAQSGPSGGRYSAQLRETATLVADEAAPGAPWDLVWQSRSGPPQVAWLEPDINDHLAALDGRLAAAQSEQPLSKDWISAWNKKAQELIKRLIEQPQPPLATERSVSGGGGAAQPPGRPTPAPRSVLAKARIDPTDATTIASFLAEVREAIAAQGAKPINVALVRIEENE